MAERIQGNIISDFNPRFEDILQDVQPLVKPLYDAYEVATLRAKEFFLAQPDDKMGSQRVNRDLYNHLVRYYAQCALAGAGIQTSNTEDEDEDKEEAGECLDCRFDVLANNGLSAKFKGYALRMLKGRILQGGVTLPFPGPSIRKREFYSQLHIIKPRLIPVDNANMESVPLRPNVVILWVVNGLYDLSSLYLSCPKGCGRYRAWDYFTKPIPHPATTMTASTEYEEEDDSFQIMKRDPKEAREVKEDEADIRRAY